MSDWRHLSAADLEQQFNPRASVPDFETWFQRFADWTAVAEPRLSGKRERRYGPGPLMTADVYAGHADSPILVFIHGGYWRGLDKRDHGFVVAPFVAAGATVVNLNYDLCPAVTVADIVDEIRAAIAWIWQDTAIPGDRQKLGLMGHSAGAHLVAMCLNHDWTRHDLPPAPITAATLISGIYEIDPVLHISVNEQVRLDGATARACSPMRLPPNQRRPILIAVGDAESDAWIAQSTDYHAVCRAAGCPADYWRLAGAHHFSILKAFTEAQHPLIAAIKRPLGL